MIQSCSATRWPGATSISLGAVLLGIGIVDQLRFQEGQLRARIERRGQIAGQQRCAFLPRSSLGSGIGTAEISAWV